MNPGTDVRQLVTNPGLMSRLSHVSAARYIDDWHEVWNAVAVSIIGGQRGTTGLPVIHYPDKKG